nr:MAG TPA: hypothetical protein [Caudoviricetes sp.]
MLRVGRSSNLLVLRLKLIAIVCVLSVSVLGGVNDVQFVDNGVEKFVGFGLCVKNLRQKLNDCGEFVVDVLHLFPPLSAENPTGEKLLAHGVSVCRVQRGRLEMVVVDGRDEMILSFKLCFHLLHALHVVTTGIPRGTIRKAVPRTLFECHDGDGVEAPHACNDVRKVFILIIDQTVNVLGRVLIDEDIGHVCRSATVRGTGISHCLQPHFPLQGAVCRPTLPACLPCRSTRSHTG